jgi:hypothetical protein
LSEVLVRAVSGGAVASFAPTGWGVAAGHDYLQKGFYDAVFAGGVRRVGDATMAGKFHLWNDAPSGAYRDLIDTYGLLGDPALEINVFDTDLQVAKEVEPLGEVGPGDLLTYTLTFTNAGPEIAHGVVLSDVLSSALIDAEVLYESPAVLGQVPGERFAWEIEDLTPGAGGEIRLRATVDPAAAAGTIENVAQLGAAEPDAVPSDNTASVSNELVVVTDWYIYLPVVLRNASTPP